MTTRLPTPAAKYDPANEAAFRRVIEQALTRLDASGGGGTAGTGTPGTIPLWGVNDTLGDSSMTESAGVVNFGARPTVGAESLAYVSQLFTQAAADARYKPIGYVPAWSEITGTPTTVAGYGITDAVSVSTGDARWLLLTGGTLTGALAGTSANFSGDVDAADFVLVGGASGGAGGAVLIDVYDEGTLLTNAMASINFVGAGVVATNVGDVVTVNITGAVTSVFGRTGAVTAQSGDYNWSQVSGGHPTTIGGYGITDFNSLGDVRWLKLTGGTLSGALAGTTASFSGEVDADDFVLVGGVGGGGGGEAPVTVYDEGTTLTSSLSSLNFVGAGVVATNTGGDVVVNITGAVTSVFGRTGAVTAQANDYTFAQLASKPTTIGGYGITDFNSLGDARWSLLGHTHTFASLTSKPTTIGGYGITDFNALGDARWSLLGHTHTFASLTSKPTTISGYGITDLHATGNAWWLQLGGSGQDVVNLLLRGNTNPYVQFYDGTYIAYWQMASGTMQLYHNGFARMNVAAGGLISFFGEVDFSTDLKLAGTLLASYSSSYHLLYRRDGGIGIYLGGADPGNYYDNGAHYFRNRASANLAVIDGSGNITATDFTLA